MDAVAGDINTHCQIRGQCLPIWYETGLNIPRIDIAHYEDWLYIFETWNYEISGAKPDRDPATGGKGGVGGFGGNQGRSTVIGLKNSPKLQLDAPKGISMM